jgi:hypothetical protein
MASRNTKPPPPHSTHGSRRGSIQPILGAVSVTSGSRGAPRSNASKKHDIESLICNPSRITPYLNIPASGTAQEENPVTELLEYIEKYEGMNNGDVPQGVSIYVFNFLLFLIICIAEKSSRPSSAWDVQFVCHRLEEIQAI